MDSKEKSNIYIASDHAGFNLKNYLIDSLKSHALKVYNLGPAEYDPSDDYPDYAKKVAEAVSQNPKVSLGIVICKNGVGVSILANKYKGVRCALSWSPQHAKSARNDDDANTLALPADYIAKETALETALAFLQTPFSKEERHIRRVKKILDMENE